MADILIYHNGECSKSKGALELLQEMGVPHDVRFYIAEPLSVEELRTLIAQLNVPISELIRKTEPTFTEQFVNAVLTDEEWIEVLADNPQLLQRPIVVKANKAIIARPPGKVLEFIQ